LDEFTIDELIQRCSNYIYLKTASSEKAQEVLNGMNIEKFEVVDKQTLKIPSDGVDSSKIIENLVKSDVAVYELAYKQMTLEEYYLNSTGRNV
jgi:hypothetical protein